MISGFVSCKASPNSNALLFTVLGPCSALSGLAHMGVSLSGCNAGSFMLQIPDYNMSHYASLYDPILGTVRPATTCVCFLFGSGVAGEAIAGVIVIGYSVDYVVHLAHMYCEAKHFGHQTRRLPQLSARFTKCTQRGCMRHTLAAS